LSSPLLAETGRCVACGLCLPHCPTYRKTQSEADSPRGRIMLTQAVLQGALPANARYAEHIDLCLTCRACEHACPNHVPYGAIVDEARALIRKNRTPPLMQRLAAHLMANPSWWRPGNLVVRLANLLRLRKFLPALPAVSASYLWRPRYDTPDAVGDVSLFLGCASSMLDTETLASAVFVLNRLGYTVHIPTGQTCCGGLHRQAGDKAVAEALEQRNCDAFGNMPVLTVASGCGARLIEAMPERVQDISTFLAQCDWQGVEVKPLDATIAVHDSCSLRNGLKAEKHPYALLQRIPGARIKVLPGNDQCCGGAGSYMLTQPEMANRLLQDKMESYQTTQSEYLATSNFGCALHLSRGLGNDTRIAHPVWIVARQMGFEGKLS